VSLSVCCLTDAPGARIRAIFASFREVADEIVIAADSRVDEADVEQYRAVADRVLRCEFEFLEAHTAWLHKQCLGDWILRLDGDEVPSPALVAALPALTAAGEVRQYWLPRRWLDPTGEGWLDELPWSPDYQNRLVRNDESLAFSGDLHSGAQPAYPARYLREPFYHLLCELETKEERHIHSLLYELARPFQVAPGGGPFNATFYLPERFARRPPRPLPAEDRTAVDAVLDGAVPAPAPSNRLLRAPAARTGITLLESDLRMYEGEARGLFVEVGNGSGEAWPGGLEEEPRVRLSYHWRKPDGTLLVADGERSALPAPLGDTESAIAPVTVIAPSGPGRYLLEIDLVHEDVRWLGCGTTCEMEVVPPGESERNFPPRGSRLLKRRLIPRLLHRVWVGPEPVPDELDESWRRCHPDWEHRVWTDADLRSLSLPEEALDPSGLSHVVRYQVLALHGGVYVNADLEATRTFDPLLRGVQAFAAYTRPGLVGTGILGAVPGHPALSRAAELSLLTMGESPPTFLTHVLADFPDVTIFPPDLQLARARSAYSVCSTRSASGSPLPRG
jgi:hypothetical protein